MSTATHDLPPRLARLHRWCRAQGWLRRFTLANRVLLAMAFLPTGLVKALGRRFTLLPVDDPIGFFFEAMYRTGPYWHFIGLVQVVSAVLLLIPRTATLGAVLFLPVGLSVFLVTVGVGFGNTVWVTGGMLLSVVYLICWDGERVWRVAATLLAPQGEGGRLLEGATRLEIVGWTAGGACGIGLFLVTRGLLPRGSVLPLLVGGACALVAVMVGWGIGLARGRAG